MKYLPDTLKKLYQQDISKITDIKDLQHPYINISDALKAHYILADYFLDMTANQHKEEMLVGLKDDNLLASAIGRQIVSFNGKNKYNNGLDICATLFYGMVKDHAFFDGNKRTSLLLLLYQMQLFGYYPKSEFRQFENLALNVASNQLSTRYKNIWKKFQKQGDAEVKTIAYLIRRLSIKKDTSYHMNITMKAFCEQLKEVGVEYKIDGSKVKFTRKKRFSIHNIFAHKNYQYTINFYGESRVVEAGAARDTFNALGLKNDFASFAQFANGEEPLYKIINKFEEPLRRLKDE